VSSGVAVRTLAPVYDTPMLLPLPPLAGLPTRAAMTEMALDATAAAALAPSWGSGGVGGFSVAAGGAGWDAVITVLDADRFAKETFLGELVLPLAILPIITPGAAPGRRGLLPPAEWRTLSFPPGHTFAGSRAVLRIRVALVAPDHTTRCTTIGRILSSTPTMVAVASALAPPIQVRVRGAKLPASSAVAATPAPVSAPAPPPAPASTTASVRGGTAARTSVGGGAAPGRAASATTRAPPQRAPPPVPPTSPPTPQAAVHASPFLPTAAPDGRVGTRIPVPARVLGVTPSSSSSSGTSALPRGGANAALAPQTAATPAVPSSIRAPSRNPPPSAPLSLSPASAAEVDASILRFFGAQVGQPSLPAQTNWRSSLASTAAAPLPAPTTTTLTPAAAAAAEAAAALQRFESRMNRAGRSTGGAATAGSTAVPTSETSGAFTRYVDAARRAQEQADAAMARLDALRLPRTGAQ
jgi:hypothetical protein